MAPEPLARHTVALTAYNALPEQTDEDPFTTASGAYSNPEVIAARSVDLASELPFGTVIEISTEGSENGSACGLSLIEDQVGYRVVADSMNPRIKGTVDLLLDHDNSVQVGKKKVNPARALGRCKNIEIKVLGRIDVKEIPATQAELKRVVSEGTLALKKW
ncbi:MAG: hypothetical protein HYS26_02835 [Candidatus Kaiserbacteria bacterium]|nr:MAG: hypothetical protein HYS26_02835 [Candidatus Kaiserbacteria bacterium]